MVLALVLNVEGLIKYSSILEGNIADSKTLSAMIEKLSKHTCGAQCCGDDGCMHCHEDNLKLIIEKGYLYLCVSRSKLIDYLAVADRLTVLLDYQIRQNHPTQIRHYPKQYRLLSKSEKLWQSHERSKYEKPV